MPSSCPLIFSNSLGRNEAAKRAGPSDGKTYRRVRSTSQRDKESSVRQGELAELETESTVEHQSVAVMTWHRWS